MGADDRFGGWSIDQKVFGWILMNIPVGSSVLELGSGWSTGELGRYYDMHSVEDELYYFNRYKSTYILAESSSGWYNRKTLEDSLHRIDYKLLLIDGPSHNKRSKIMENMDLFRWSVPVIIDDYQEGDIKLYSDRIADEYCKRPFEIIRGTEKLAMVIP